VNPPGSRFCNGCGHDPSLPSKPIPKDLSFDEKIDKIQRYFLVWFALLNHTEACVACCAGYAPGAERFNKPLADLRIIYEKKGRDALPYIRDALMTSTDPLVMKRAAEYIVDLNDREIIN
jgi:hypothetical protein